MGEIPTHLPQLVTLMLEDRRIKREIGVATAALREDAEAVTQTHRNSMRKGWIGKTRYLGRIIEHKEGEASAVVYSGPQGIEIGFFNHSELLVIRDRALIAVDERHADYPLLPYIDRAHAGRRENGYYWSTKRRATLDDLAQYRELFDEIVKDSDRPFVQLHQGLPGFMTVQSRLRARGG